jgi:parallel beta-helix repeat protein
LIKVNTGNHVVFDGITVRNTRGIGAVLQANTKNSGVRKSQFVNVGNHWKTTLQRLDRIQGLVFCCGNDNSGNFAIGNRFEDIGLDALQIGNQRDFVATNNVFDLENGQLLRVKSSDYPAGIFLQYSSNVTISRNVIRGAQGNGIDAPALQRSRIANNTVIDSGCAGIGLFQGYDKKTQSMGISVVDNIITNNVHWAHCTFKGGITISEGAPRDIVISGNVVTDTQFNKTQLFGVQVRTRVLNLEIDHSNKLAGNRDADLDGASYSSK